ncbi:branched-chain amino acid ABC transporter permease [Nocardioides sp. ChNu-99]|uniref:branched-chain amino acid ABC transporter permease n=1 Tax=Nocardioides sp. ChNu-99 TaxID=2839897 RepID=UPI00240661EC|nr:branched-chain amino acid ABC transporter permease [Nocardioides sp. ChNu-99]MDF9714811.1 branched-chain amino acid ABC transporter permease [Nocardioides sp. ChNu-99]
MPALRPRLGSSPLLRHLLVALVGGAVALAVLTAVDDFRAGQLAAMAYLGIAAAGLTVLTGLNGQLSLGHGAFMAIGAYTAALFLGDVEPAAPLAVVLLAATAVASLVGLVVGLAAARLHGPYLAGATLALAVAVPGLAIYFGDTLGGEQGLSVRVPEPPAWFADLLFFLTAVDPSRGRFVAYLSWFVLIVVLVLLANLSQSRVGRTWRAVRDHEVAAELAGISLTRARVVAFVVSAATAGLAGALMAMVVRLTAPSGFTLTLSLTLLTAVVLGGLGSLAGALIGAALLTFLPQVVTGIGSDLGLDDVQSAELAPLVYGVVMILVILLAPAGLVGTLQGWRLRRRAAAGPAAPAVPATTRTSDPTRPSDPTHPTHPTDKAGRA